MPARAPAGGICLSGAAGGRMRSWKGGAMPSDFSYRDDSDVYVTVYWGTVSIVDILETILERAHDSDLKNAKAHLVDLSHAAWAETPPHQIHQELQRLRPAFAPPKLPTVFVTPGEFFYGFARMYALMEVIYGAAKVDVFRTWGDASAALGIPLASAEAWALDRSRGGS